ncbi:MAG: ABC transporter permease [Chloroflexi bacterium]|nr:ABC transporter permease [Chloroflexota bacterium]
MTEVDIGVALIATIGIGIRFSVPIALGALSGIFSERSGVVNIGIEGMMLMAAFVGFMANVTLAQPDNAAVLQHSSVRFALAIGAALLAGGCMGLLHGVLSIQYKIDQIISGTVINILALGLTGYFYDPEATLPQDVQPLLQKFKNPFPESSSATRELFPNFTLSFPNDIGQIIFEKDLITYLTLGLIVFVGWALYNTTWGLRTRAIGENPRAADTLGINVYRLQYTNLFIGGMIAGLAGAFLTLAAVSQFERGMTTGRGFIALAVMIFGNWRPSGAVMGALLFGMALALQNTLQGFGVNVPHQFVGMLPYVLTIVVLAGFVGRVQPPAHAGRAYEQE